MTAQHSELAVRILQDRSANIQGLSRGPALKIDLPLPFERIPGRNKEYELNNGAGDHVMRHQYFYQLTEVERHNYNTLLDLAYKVQSYVRYRGNQGQKTKGNQDVWDGVREDLFFKGM